MSLQFSAGISKAVCIVALVFASATSVAEDATQYELNIAPQNIEQALRRLAEITGKELLFLFDQMESLESEQISGTYTIEDALAIILENTSLSGELTQDGVILITPKQKESAGSAMDVKKAGLIAVVVGALTGDVNAQEPAVTEQGIQTSVVTGKVMDARTGANLKGAKVTIEEAGQWTSTNDLGEFRFVNVPIGSATLTVSYLGYVEQSAVIGIRGDSVAQDFSLRGGSEIEEIVVFGQRSARAQALNQERTAENSRTVLSADLLGNFVGTTISESLRRAPGVAFEEDRVTGDGTNVIVRGLAPDFNTVTLNGLRLPEGSGLGRSPTLSNILTESISKITVSTTLLPSQDSSGTGGLVDIETKSPLDRPRRFASFGLQRGVTSADDFLDEVQVSGTLSAKFGDADNFGISASIQYRDRDVRRISYRLSPSANGIGQYLPLDSQGMPISSTFNIDPRLAFPFEPGVDEYYPRSISIGQNAANVNNLAISASAHWRPIDHSDFRLTFNRNELRQDDFFRNANPFALTAYELLPIDELAGEERFALVWEDARRPGAIFNVGHEVGINEGREDTIDTVSLEGKTELSQWSFDYTLGYARGRSESPFNLNFGLRQIGFLQTIDQSFLLPQALENTINGRLISPFAARNGGGFPVPLLNDAGYAFYNDITNYRPSSAIIAGRNGSNTRFTTKFSTRYQFDDSIVNYLEAGVFYEDSEFRSVPVPSKFYRLNSGFTVQDLGVIFAPADLSDVNIENGFFVPIRENILSIFSNPQQFLSGSNPVLSETVFPFDERLDQTFTKEGDFAAYLQGRIDINDLEIIGGLRLSHVKVSARNRTSPTLRLADGTIDDEFGLQFARLVDQEASQAIILPRVLLNYRASDRLIFRGGYFLSIARPQIQNLSTDQNIFLDLRPVFGPNGNQPRLTYSEGNPDLAPAKTHNFDIGVEYYDGSLGVIKIAAFYKEIDNFLEFNVLEGVELIDGLDLPADPRFQNLPPNLLVQGIRPINNAEPAKIWGVVTSIERQFTSLPGVLSGLGLYANYTYSDSSKTEIGQFRDPVSGELVDFTVSDVPFNAQPKHSGTVATTYNKYAIDATLAYTTQSRRLVSFQDFGLGRYTESDSSLDLRLEYQFEKSGADWRVFLEGSDLLKSSSDPDVEASIGGGTQRQKSIQEATILVVAHSHLE